MPKWLKVVRGMIGTGVTFAAGVGLTVGGLGAIGMLAGEVTGIELLQVVGKFSVVSFVLGVLFSGVLAMTSRGRAFEKLSLRSVSLMGAGGGFLYWLFLASTGGRVWSLSNAIGNFVILLLMGSMAAAGTLLLARKAGRTLSSGATPHSLRGGMHGEPLSQQAPEHESHS